MTERGYTPLVRKLAQAHGVDLDAVNGTGVAGRVTKADVVAAGTWRAEIQGALSRGAITRDRVPAYEAMAQENPVATVRLLRQLVGMAWPDSLTAGSDDEDVSIDDEFAHLFRPTAVSHDTSVDEEFAHLFRPSDGTA